MTTSRSTIRTWVRRVWVTAGLLFTAWIVWNMQEHGVAPHLKESSQTITVEETGDALLFEPAAPSVPTPLVFLPGGGVDPDAYLPLIRALSERGVTVALVPLPWRMAFSAGARQDVWRRTLRVAARWSGRTFVLAGHSRGAALASQFASENPDVVAGLLLIGTTHPKTVDLSRLSVPVLKIAGTRDCVAPLDASRANASRLPAHTTWAILEGANHAQFGYYGTQPGDCTATISRETQHDQVTTTVDRWLRSALPVR